MHGRAEEPREKRLRNTPETELSSGSDAQGAEDDAGEDDGSAEKPVSDPFLMEDEFTA